MSNPPKYTPPIISVQPGKDPVIDIVNTSIRNNVKIFDDLVKCVDNISEEDRCPFAIASIMLYIFMFPIPLLYLTSCDCIFKCCFNFCCNDCCNKCNNYCCHYCCDHVQVFNKCCCTS